MQQSISKGRALVIGIAKWLGTLGVHMMSLETPDIQVRTPKADFQLLCGGTVSRQGLQLTEIPEEPEGHQWQPRILHREASKVGAAVVARSKTDAGAAGAECPKAWKEARFAHRSHNLREAGRFVFCRACGGHTSGRRSTVLRKGCCGESMTTGCRRLRIGRHPISDLSLGPVRRWAG